MAQSGEKTEQPSARRLEEQRRKGNVPLSAELPSALTLLAAMTMLLAFASPILANIEAELRAALSLEQMPGTLDALAVQRLALHAVYLIALSIGPLLLAILVVGVLSHIGQVGFRFSPGVLRPSLNRINPKQGAKNLFNRRSAVEFIKNILKMAAVGLIAFMTLKGNWHKILLLSGATPGQIFDFSAQLIVSIAFRICIFLLVMAAFDFYFQRRNYLRELRMTKQEVREEMKQTEMNMRVRGRIREDAMKAARSRMLSEVPKADVVITNPTHYACAMRYKDGEDAAPVLIAKGQDLLALQIRQIAADNKIPIIENPPVARTLYSKVEVGQVIPESLFVAVAEIIGLVWQMQGRRVKKS